MEAAEIRTRVAGFGYRVSDGHSVLAYLSDHCPTALGPGPQGWASTTRPGVGQIVLAHHKTQPSELALDLIAARFRPTRT